MSKKPRKKKRMRTAHTAVRASATYSDAWIDDLDAHLGAAEAAYTAFQQQEAEVARLQAEAGWDAAEVIAAVEKLKVLGAEQERHLRAALGVRPDAA